MDTRSLQDDIDKDNQSPCSAVTKFPAKLHFLLNEMEKDGLQDVVSWQPHGRSFIVHKAKEFEKTILPFYFQQSKFTSFQRQLSFYGFRRITTGADKGGYYHEFFLRGQEDLAHKIQRTKCRGTREQKLKSTDYPSPNFYRMPSISGENEDNATDDSCPNCDFKDKAVPHDEKAVAHVGSTNNVYDSINHKFDTSLNAGCGRSLQTQVSETDPSLLYCKNRLREASSMIQSNDIQNMSAALSMLNQVSSIQTKSPMHSLSFLFPEPGDVRRGTNLFPRAFDCESNHVARADILRIIETAQSIVDHPRNGFISRHHPEIASSFISTRPAPSSALLQFIQRHQMP